MITLENYIMESEINDSTVGDIYVEQAMAEMEVAYALANSYMKDAMYVEYMAEMNNVDAETFMEAAADAVDGTGKMSIGEKIKSGASSVGRFFIAIGRAILTAITNFWHFLTERSLKSCIKKLDAMPEMTWKFPVGVFRDNERIIELSNEFCDIVKKGCVDKVIEREAFKDVLHRLSDPNAKMRDLNETRMKVGNMVEIETSELREKLIRWTSTEVKKQISDAIKAYKALIKYIEDTQKNELVKGSDTYKDDKRKYKMDKAMDKTTLKLVKETGSALVKAWNDCLRADRQVANEVLSKQKKDLKAHLKSGKKRNAGLSEDERIARAGEY